MKSNPRTDIGLLLLRLGLGMTFLYFGSQKVLGLFGGFGYTATLEAFTKEGIPPVLAHLAINAEFFGGLGVLVGGLTSIAAFGIACVMSVATYMNVRPEGTLAEIFTQSKDPHRLFFSGCLLFLALGIMVMGAGRYSLDYKFTKSRPKR